MLALAALACIALLVSVVAGGSSSAPVAKPSDVGVVDCSTPHQERHNPGLAAKTGDDVAGGLVCFDAFISSFDVRRQPENRDEDFAFLRVPRWVAQQIVRAKSVPESNARPGTWMTVPELNDRNIAPTDGSYKYSKSFRDRHPNWYDRGHMAQKYLAERLAKPDGDPKKQPAWFTHNVVNAVPQRSRFNSFPWLQLECYTGALANRFGKVWVITGPVFLHDEPVEWLRERGRKVLPVAIPEALFKIVVREGEAGKWQALAFVYPQDHPDYHKKGPWPPKKWLSSISKIEKMTDNRFFVGADLPPEFKERKAAALWPVEAKDFDPGCKKFAKEVK